MPGVAVPGLPPDWDAVVHRLAVGVEPLDALSRQPVGSSLVVCCEDVPRPYRVPAATGPLGIDPRLGLPQLGVRGGRFALLYRDGLRAVVDLRIVDPTRRFVPRRLRIRVVDPLVVPGADARLVEPTGLPPGRQRHRRILLYPAAAYSLAPGSTGLRLALQTNGPARWARVAAHLPNGDGTAGELVGRAHADERGEALLVVSGSERLLDAVDRKRRTVELLLVAAAPPQGSPTADSLTGGSDDPLWDLPIEVLAAPSLLDPDPPAPDPVAEGVTPPASFTETSVQRVECTIGRVRAVPTWVL